MDSGNESFPYVVYTLQHFVNYGWNIVVVMIEGRMNLDQVLKILPMGLNYRRTTVGDQKSQVGKKESFIDSVLP